MFRRAWRLMKPTAIRKTEVVGTLKSVSLTGLQTIRLVMMLDQHQGQRKALRMVAELKERIGISDEDWQKMLTPVENGFQISPDVLKRPEIEVPMIPEEARKCLEILDGQTLTARDLEWAEPLARQLEAIV